MVVKCFRGCHKIPVVGVRFEVLSLSEWAVLVVQGGSAVRPQQLFLDYPSSRRMVSTKAHAADFDEKIDGVARFDVGEVLRHFTIFVVIRSKGSASRSAAPTAPHP